MIFRARFSKPPAVIKHSRLAKFELELGGEIGGLVVEERSTIEVGFGRGRILLLEEKANDSNVDLKLVFV